MRLNKPITLHKFCILVALLVSPSANSVEYILNEEPVPESVNDDQGPIEHAFVTKPLSEKFMLEGLKSYLQDKPSFWRDSKLNYAMRTYMFNRRNSESDKPEATVTGGRVNFQSGWQNNLSTKIAYYNSTELDASGPDTGLLESGQKNISVFGEANIRYRFSSESAMAGSEVALYRQELSLPYVNKHDIRQLPTTYEAYSLFKKDSAFNYYLGHVTAVKRFDSDKFVKMSEAAGAEDTNEGLTIIGARKYFGEHTSIGAAEYYGWDTFNILFAEATHRIKFSDELSVKLAGQYTDQRSVGDELIGDFDTYHYALSAKSSWKGATITLAGSVTDDNAAVNRPWGGGPSYLSVQRYDFDRANERAVLLGFSYNTDYFSALGISSFVNIVHGWDAIDPETNQSLPDRTEYDFTVDYKPPAGSLEGLWVRLRYNYIDEQHNDERIYDFRLIVNYTFDLL